LAGWQCDLAPVSDGGEGFLDAFVDIGQVQATRVASAAGKLIEAEWLLGSDQHGRSRRLAVVESARAIGLALAGGAEGNDPVGASSKGAGQLVMAAVRAGAKQVVVGMGGSATTDGGLGAVEAIGHRERLAGVELLVACDVTTKFLDAATLFAPQKGAQPAQVALLERRLQRVAQMYLERFGVDVTCLEGGGAAGGLAGGFAAMGARLVAGFDLVAERLSLSERMASAELVVTGEGYLDVQSFAGKAVGGVVGLAREAGVPVLVVVGDADEAVAAERVSLVQLFGWERATKATAACITQVVAGRLARGPRS